MARVQLAIVGCGGMGRRHLAGLAELARTDHNNLDLVAVCDLNEQNAEDLADEAAAAARTRPAVFTDAARMKREAEGSGGGRLHDRHRLAPQGRHRAARPRPAHAVREAAGADHARLQPDHRRRRAKRQVLSVAENFRRDPINRLVRALLDDGAIGERQFIMETGVSGRDNMFITPWRHHEADRHALRSTPASTTPTSCSTTSATPTAPTARPASTRRRAYAATPPVPAASTRSGRRRCRRRSRRPARTRSSACSPSRTARSASGSDHHAGHGERFSHRLVFGTTGSIAAPGDRNGRPVRLVLDDGTDIADERHARLRAELPAEPGRRRRSSAASGSGPTISTSPPPTARSSPSSMHEFAECVRTGAQPEVDGATGRARMAIIYALFESQVAGRPVTVDEVDAGALDAYQQEIDEHRAGAGWSPRRRVASRPIMGLLLSYSTWGMPEVPIDVAVEHCAGLGFDGLELTVIPGLDDRCRQPHLDRAARIRRLYDRHNLDSGRPLRQHAAACDLTRPSTPPSSTASAYLDLAAELQHAGRAPGRQHHLRRRRRRLGAGQAARSSIISATWPSTRADAASSSAWSRTSARRCTSRIRCSGCWSRSIRRG